MAGKQGSARIRTKKRSKKEQVSIEYMVIFAFAFLIVAVVIGYLYTVGLHNTTYTNSYCYITPELPCQGMYVIGNPAVPTNAKAYVIFTNNKGTGIYVKPGSFYFYPGASSTFYSGECIPSNIPQGGVAVCNVTISNIASGSLQSGSQVNPKFSMSYGICSNNYCNGQSANAPVFNITGTGTTYVALSAPSLYYITVDSASINVTVDGVQYAPGSKLVVFKNTQYTLFGDLPAEYSFNTWTSTGGVSVASSTSQSTTFTATSNGTIKGIKAGITSSTSSTTSTSTTSSVLYYTFTESSNPSPDGSVSPGTGSYPAGSVVSIDANPITGYHFVDWTCTGTGCYSGTSQSSSVVLSVDNMQETANFAPNSYTLTTGATPAGDGTVSPSSGSYTFRSAVTISESSSTSNTFTGWSCSGTGCYSGTATSNTIIIYGNTVETASFSPYQPFTEIASPTAGGSVSPGSNSVPYGTSVTISESPSSGYHFVDWTCSGTGCYSGTSNSDLITINNAVTETANFASTTTTSTTTSTSTSTSTSISTSSTSTTVSTSTTTAITVYEATISPEVALFTNGNASTCLTNSGCSYNVVPHGSSVSGATSVSMGGTVTIVKLVQIGLGMATNGRGTSTHIGPLNVTITGFSVNPGAPNVTCNNGVNTTTYDSSGIHQNGNTYVNTLPTVYYSSGTLTTIWTPPPYSIQLSIGSDSTTNAGTCNVSVV